MKKKNGFQYREILYINLYFLVFHDIIFNTYKKRRFFMLLALAGVTGVGKSYFKDKIVEKLGFEKIKIITTREIRNGEKNNEDKIFVTPSELNNLKESNKIAYDFNMLGNIYAYSKDSLFSNKNTVFELHYSTIFNFRNICPNLTSIYILPQDIEMAKEQTKKRHLKPNVEKNRLLEIDEHYNSAAY